jgi:integrase
MGRPKKPYSVITRSGSQCWQYRLEGWSRYKPTPIKVVYRSGEPRNEAAALAWAAEEWKKLEKTSVIETQGPTLRAFLEPFFVPATCPHIARIIDEEGRYSERWAREQRSRLKRYVFTDPIAKKIVSDLRRGDFDDLKRRLKEQGLSPHLINITMGAIKTCFRERMEREEIERDPTAGIRKSKEKTGETGIFSLDEVRRIISEPKLFTPRVRNYGILRGPRPEDLAYTFFVLCGLIAERPDAVLSLRWGDVRDDVVTFRETKTAVDGRRVPVVAKVVDALDALRSKSLRTGDRDWIFGAADGVQCVNTWYRKRFRAMMGRAEFPACDADGRRRITYSLKHSFITHLVDMGADEVLVREYVGHSHGHGTTRVLTPVQAIYKHRQAARLRELLPWIEKYAGLKKE